MSDLATIRKTHGNHSASQAPACDGCALLAHIDALAAKVNERFDDAARYMGRRDGMVYGDVSDEWGMTRAAVLAILRDEEV